MTANTFDAVIIGGGHNGLVTAAYLARAWFQRSSGGAFRLAGRKLA